MAGNHRFNISTNPNDRGVWGFNLNPLDHNMRPALDQNIIQLNDGSAFIMEPRHDSTVLTLTWQNIPEEDYGEFLLGLHENLQFSRVFFYYTQGQSPVTITDMTYQARTADTINMPFEENGTVYREALWNDSDRLFVGAESKFYGVLFDFEDYHSNQVDADGNLYVDDIRIRFSVASGDLTAGDSLTFDGTTLADDDDTELFQHYGQIVWTATQTGNWAKASMNDILTGTSEFTTPTGFSDSTELYWAEIRLNPDSAVVSTMNPKLQGIKTAIDSLDGLSARKSNGILPVWWLNVPTVLKKHRPRGYREDDWIGIIVTNFEATVSNGPEQRWNIVLSFIPVANKESSKTFVLDRDQLDGESFLG